jgi:chromate reductase
MEKIGILVGSLRKASYSRMIAENVADMLAANAFDVTWPQMGDLPLYNQDLDEDAVPKEWTIFREQVRACDGFLFVTPEYNRSVPAVIKNALDVASRPYGQSAWDGRPGGIISVAPGKMGAFGANHHLRQSMVFLNVYMMEQPEAYIGGVADLLDEEGNLVNEGTRKFLRQYTDAFTAWVRRFA